MIITYDLKCIDRNNLAIKTYNEAAWSELSKTKHMPMNISLPILQALHLRWLELFKNIHQEDWQKTLYHSEYKRKMSLWVLLKTYAWQCKHHVAHVTFFKEAQRLVNDNCE